MNIFAALPLELKYRILPFVYWAKIKMYLIDLLEAGYSDEDEVFRLTYFFRKHNMKVGYIPYYELHLVNQFIFYLRKAHPGLTYRFDLRKLNPGRKYRELIQLAKECPQLPDLFGYHHFLNLCDELGL